jgi:hypothetical protein
VLRGERMIPVLPMRDYPQEHGYEVYHPAQSGVRWVEAENWIVETRVI